ncbi:flagellar basal body L-ring protein FlgH [Novosphingobium profundi]|uniref:flagellar basal body L-ring protein FlgH n=1 Tax=Novosphingobium profundi TaxID=1774954 RepID=UPI001BDB56F4|nr:flagellar basal body L-ring protein FlgH [Novosphingobium profundi]MBT0670580.1 flagellar basal body L-ring protein FlgH [Novosphingobium profundi]
MTSRIAPAAPTALALLSLSLALSGCGAVGRLKSVGKAPKLSAAEAPVAPTLVPSLGNSTASGRTGATDPAQAAAPRGASLFRTGAGAFFNDQRASRVGDIVTIKINIADNATVNNSTTRTRDGSETGSVAALLGLEGVFGKNPSSAVDTSTSSSTVGVGDTKRSEQINMTIAATVVGVLPNGNLQIRGRQEVRVNFELRELVVTGIIRPEDIGRDNSINHTQIADARISYGGRGQLTDAQQARWGQQIYDALFPF